MSDQCTECPIETVHNVHASLSGLTDMLAGGSEAIERDGLYALLYGLERRLRPAVDELDNYTRRK